jgi:tetratricopeptide (TPR) repeat protein
MKYFSALFLSLLMLASAGCQAEDAADIAACGSNTGTPDDVIAACGRALAREGVPVGTRTRLLVGRSMARQAQGQGDAALADMDEAVRLSPDWAEVLVNRGNLHRMRGELDAALRDFDAALALDPAQPRTWLLRAAAHDTAGAFALARADADRGLAVDASFALLWTERCWAGAVLADELPRTLEDCNHALALDPKDANNENNLGFVHFRMGHHDLAIEHYTRSIEASPDWASSYLVRGLSRRAVGDTEGATADIAKARSIDPAITTRYAAYGVDVGGK